MTPYTHPQCRATGASLLLLAGLYSPLCAQEPDITLAPDGDHYELGSAFAVLGDLDGDGTADYAVADRTAMVDDQFSAGIVHVVSGADGSFIRSLTGTPGPSQGFGSALAGLDADGDGLTDLAVGSPGQQGPAGFGVGALRVYSGADGSLLHETMGTEVSLFGAALANAGDQNGDGLEDLFVGAPRGDGSKGKLYVVSGADGGMLREIATEAPVCSFASTLATVADIDGDGLADVAVGSPSFLSGRDQIGRVQLIRSTDGGTAAEVTGAGFYGRLGDSLATVADANDDGMADLLAGSYSGGTCLLLSGTDLSTIADLSIPDLPAYTPTVAGGSIDYNGDGIKDWLIGSSGLGVLDGRTVGGLRILSGSDQSVLFERLASEGYSGLGQSLKVLPGLGFAAGETYKVDPDTYGSGYAYLWKVDEPEVDIPVDTDGDGVLDEDDLVSESITDKTVILLGLDSGVENRVDETGTTLADRFAELGEASDYRRPVFYFIKAMKLTKSLWRENLLSKREASRISHAALRGVTRLRKAERIKLKTLRRKKAVRKKNKA